MNERKDKIFQAITENNKDKVKALLKSPEALWKSKKIVNRLCRKCRYKVLTNADKGLVANKDKTCKSCKKIWELIENE